MTSSSNHIIIIIPRSWARNPRLRILPDRKQCDRQRDSREGNRKGKGQFQPVHVREQDPWDLVWRKDGAELGCACGDDEGGRDSRGGGGEVGEETVGEGGLCRGDEEGAADGLEDCVNFGARLVFGQGFFGGFFLGWSD